MTLDPWKVLKDLSKSLLRQLLTGLPDFPWDALGETDVEPIVNGIQNLPEKQRREVQVVLQDVLQLADETGRGLRVLSEELRLRAPERLPEFAAIPSRLDKALWVYLNVREAFDEAALFAHIDALMGGRSWVRRDDLPKRSITFSDAMKVDLQNALRGYYWPNEVRGEFCEVHHHQRLNGAEYFFAYMDDWPDRPLIFDGVGHMEHVAQRYAFSNVFVYTPSEGALDLIAKGGQDVYYPLQKAFCSAVLEIEVEPADPVRPVYELDTLLDPSFSFQTADDHLESARLARIRMLPKDGARDFEYLEVKFRRNTSWANARSLIDQELAHNNLSRSQVTVKQAGIQLTWLSDGQKKGRQATFNVSCPNSCDLKSKPEEVRLAGENCLRLWRVIDA